MMSAGLTTEVLRQGIKGMASKMERCFDELNTLDSQLGDGDIGITMVTGFRAIAAIAGELPDDVGMALLKCAQTFTGTRASSFGALLATGILAAAKEVKGEQTVAWSKIPVLLERGIEKMAQRGRSSLGEKTVLDELEEIRKALVGMDKPAEMMAVAHRAAIQALEDFKNRPCQQGRARIFADKTVGMHDPGMVVIQKLVEGLHENEAIPSQLC